METIRHHISFQPDVITIGASVRLVSMNAFAKELGLSRESAISWLQTLTSQVRFHKIGVVDYVNLLDVERAIIGDAELMRVGAEMYGNCSKRAIEYRLRELADLEAVADTTDTEF